MIKNQIKIEKFRQVAAFQICRHFQKSVRQTKQISLQSMENTVNVEKRHVLLAFLF